MTYEQTLSGWQLDFGSDHVAAIGEHVLAHLVPEPALFSVPCAPHHCRHVMPWQGRMLPVWDFAAWVEGSRQLPPKLLAVVAFAATDGQQADYGALLLAEPVRRFRTSDGEGAALPEAMECWRPFAISGVHHDGHYLPILDLARVFSSRQGAGILNAPARSAPR